MPRCRRRWATRFRRAARSSRTGARRRGTRTYRPKAFRRKAGPRSRSRPGNGVCYVQRAVIHEREQLQRIELPRFAQIEPVGRRPLSRSLSPIAIKVDGRRGGPPGFLSFDAFCRLLEQLPGLEKLHLASASEPLLHPRFFDMVRHASARGVEVSTTTRLTVLNERRAEECVKSGLRRMQVPLDAVATRVS